MHITPASDDWLMKEDQFSIGHLPHFESIFTLANGYMGVRGSLETNPTLGDTGFFVAGVFDKVGGFVHEMVNLPIWIGVDMNVDGFPVDLRKGTLLEYTRTLDMKQGILFTHIIWRDAANHTTQFELGRLVHRTEKHLGLQWGRITPLDYCANIKLDSTLDAWAVKYGSASKAARLTDHKTEEIGEQGIGLSVSTMATNLRIATASRFSATGATNRQTRRSDDRIAETFVTPLVEGKPMHFEKRAITYTSRDVDNPETMAAESLERLREQSLQDIVKEHVDAWADVWKRTDVIITGDARAQKALRFNNFHLASLANPGDELVSIGAKGLHGNGYAGVYFWDTEIYMLPFYTHTDPAAAKALLKYRYHFLDDARANAKDLGCYGAFYPWNSSLTGRGQHGKHWQEHVGSDVAYGIDWYARATGDTNFLYGEGAEIFFETARYWQSRVEPHPARGYVITGLMGPDEIHGNVDNNAYTNCLVKWHLSRAAELAAELISAGLWQNFGAKLEISETDIQAWRDIAENLYFPFDVERNIHEQFEGYFNLPEKEIDRSLSRMQYTGPVQHSFRPTKVAQQADTVLMYWMFSETFDKNVRKNGYEYYHPRCSHTSSLSRCIFSAVAAQTGLADEAYRQFMLSAENDFAEGTEMESESGIHAACMGGTWLAAITGFGGVWPRGDTLGITPALPAHWKRMTFPLVWQGTVLDVDIERDKIHLKTRGGAVSVTVGEEKLTVDECGACVEANQRPNQETDHGA